MKVAKTLTLVGICYAHGILDRELIDKMAKELRSVLRDREEDM